MLVQQQQKQTVLENDKTFVAKQHLQTISNFMSIKTTL